MYYEFIQQLIKICGYSSYLELGTWTGSCFTPIVPLVKRAVGVDLVDRREVKTGTFFEMSTVAYFQMADEKFDCIFIDAEHGNAAIRRDLNFAMQRLNDGGTILAHDLDPATAELEDPGRCSDGYKILVDLNDQREWEALTLPVGEAGLTLIRRYRDKRVLMRQAPSSYR